MKIAVTRSNGDTEIIVLVDPVEVCEGKHQASIHSADGMDHYFRLSDGCYDGWGYGVPSWTDEQAKTLAQQISESRKVIPLTLSRFISLTIYRYYKKAVWWKGYLLQLPGYPRWGQR